MTHDELLDKIEREKNFLKTQCYEGSAIGTFTVIEALRAVVELHKPDESDFPDEWESCVECSIGGLSAFYPCNTIQAIEKELR